MIRLAMLTFILALALPAVIAVTRAAELPPRPHTDRVAGDKTRLADADSLPAPTPSRPTLKAEAVIAGDVVRIGDLIENAGPASEVAIFRAPDLGQTGTVPAESVLEAVLPHKVYGLDTRGIAEVVVTRASRSITPKDLEARILRALAGQSGLPEAKNLSVLFDNDVRPLQVEAAASAELHIVRMTYDPRSGRFDVMFDLPGSRIARRAPLRYTGAVAETFEALVPTRQIAVGEAVKESDLTVVRRPKSEFSPAVIVNTEQAVGLSSKRVLRPGQIMRQGDLAKPEIIARNEAITISYAVPGIVLSIRGQALEPGTMGDVINVLNVQSKKTIQATVTGPGRVSVTATSPRIAAAADNTAP